MTNANNVNEARIPLEEASQLLQMPVGPAKGGELMSIFMDLTKDPGNRETAGLYRKAHAILDSIGFMDAADYNEGRNAFATWFHSDRKKFMSQLLNAADALES